MRQEELTDAIDTILRKTGRSVAKQARALLIGLGLIKKLAKDDAEVSETAEGDMFETPPKSEIKSLSGFWESFDISAMLTLATTVQPFLSEVMKDSGKYVILQLGLDDKITGVVNKDSLEYAEDRAAEMVGKKWVNGQLVDNPNAKWVITDTTREEVRQLVEKVARGEMNATDLPAAIRNAGAFSRSRAAMIARTELMAANAQGSLSSMFAARNAGVKVQKVWMTDGEACDICVINEKKGAIPIDKLFPDGSLAPPSHPNCECVLVPEVALQEGD